jgi:hypothetical protein
MDFFGCGILVNKEVLLGGIGKSYFLYEVGWLGKRGREADE